MVTNSCAGRLVPLGLLTFLLLGFSALAVGGEESAWPSAPASLDKGCESYLREVRQTLREHPEGEVAPQKLFEALMVATVEKDTALAKQLRNRLLVAHPASLQMTYLISALEPKQVRELLDDAFEAEDGALEPKFAGAYGAALQEGLRVHGPALASEDAFLLKSLLVAEAVRSPGMRSLLLERLKATGSEEAREIARIAFETGKDDVQKLVTLHALDHGTISAFERFYLARLSAKQRDVPAVVRIRAERCLANDDFEDAIPLFEKLLVEGRDPHRAVLSRSALGKAT